MGRSKSAKDLQDLTTPLLTLWRELQLQYFVATLLCRGQLYLEHNATAFEQLCILGDQARHGICKTYTLLGLQKTSQNHPTLVNGREN